MIALRVLLGIPTKFKNGNNDGKRETTKQDHKDSANVLDTQRIGLGVFAFVLSVKKKLFV